MATKKAHRSATITARIHRGVTAETPTPYLAQVMNMRDEPTQIVVMVTEVVFPGRGIPPFGRATVFSNVKRSHFYRRGEVVRVDNFQCLRRLEIAEVANA